MTNIFNSLPHFKPLAINGQLVVTLCFSVLLYPSINENDSSTACANCLLQDSDERNKFSKNEILESVEMELNAMGHPFQNEVDVELDRGIVTLSGSLPSLWARQRVTERLSLLRGLRGIVNQIEIPATGIDDQNIQQSVDFLLTEDAVTGKQSVEPSVESGKVTLRGNVDSHVQKLAAARLAARVKGVIDVNSSELVVNDTTTRSDGEIKNDVQRRLAINPTLDASRLTIEVDSGNVKLSGKVDSLAERSQIEIQSWLTGVKSVDAKEIEVDPTGLQSRRKAKFDKIRQRSVD